MVCDRFSDSTHAYQGSGRGVPHAFIDAIENLILHGFAPDLTLILDIDPAAGLARTSDRAGNGSREDARFERFGMAFHKTLQAAFREIAANNPQRCVMVDASRPEEDVAESIWQAVSSRFGH